MEVQQNESHTLDKSKKYGHNAKINYLTEPGTQKQKTPKKESIDLFKTSNLPKTGNGNGKTKHSRPKRGVI